MKMSKIKQQLEKEIVITYSSEESTGWKRYISFDYEGNKYDITLYWDEFNGYEITWRYCNDKQMAKAPDWAINWKEDENEGASLSGYLDLLSWEKGE
jgi:hypothetical protein